ncbi:condensation domain-containing protein [Williamsia sterculiae]|uniref:Condensation domain-containing protein n=1 Tax=Williamsia sterculiae TaxID=1344003 RepID=A0A1N7GI84_9NOCA|nr:condensation domain-containing protein [Williamsia sterculiae]SIS12314.1 Condensation domain-containing protein [Williamsia sterculiae]
MVSFGLIEDWHPRPGRVTSWVPTAASSAAAAAAPTDPVPPSHQQQEYLRSARRNAAAGFRFSRLCLLCFDIQGALDVEAMTSAITTFLRRHDTFASWFDLDDDGSVTRHVLATDDIDVEPAVQGSFDDAETIRDLVGDHTPGPFDWDCFRIGTIEWNGGFTVFAAVDHLDTDGISQALTATELMSLYLNAAFAMNNPLPEVGSYHDYCRRERDLSARLTLDSPEVARWLELVRDNGGRLPSFPLTLGRRDDDPSDHTRSAIHTAQVFTEPQARAVDEVCRRHGAGFTAAVMSVAALAYAEFTGSDRYFGLTPKSTRRSAGEMNTIGWFTSLIPVPIEVPTTATFTSIVGAAQEAFEKGKDLTDVSFHRVLELATPDSGVHVSPGWSVPMVSYVDVRKLPGVEMFDAINGALYGSRGSSEEVFMWVNRFTDVTSVTLLYPDTPEAQNSIKIYVERLVEILTTIAAQGDYEPGVAALAR